MDMGRPCAVRCRMQASRTDARQADSAWLRLRYAVRDVGAGAVVVMVRFLCFRV